MAGQSHSVPVQSGKVIPVDINLRKRINFRIVIGG